MKELLAGVVQNDLFLFLMQSVFAQTVFTAAVIGLLQVPPDIILDSGLDEIILVFEGMP